MKLRFLSLSCLFLLYNYSFAQNKLDIKAIFNVDDKQILISQTIQYQNTSTDELQTIYLNNWNNSYATKTTPLAIRIADEYRNEFHLAENQDRGYSIITSIKQNNKPLPFSQLKAYPDVIEVPLITPLKPNAYYTLNLEYIVQVPNDAFTSYGVNSNGDFNLKYWYITPAIYNGTWQYFSNKDLDDMFIPSADINLEIECPINYILTSELDVIKTSKTANKQIVTLQGENRVNSKLFITKNSSFKSIQTDAFSVVTDINDDDLQEEDKVLSTNKVTKFIDSIFGNYPHKKLLLTNIDYKKDPIYGLNFLPSFLKPYPVNFSYELKLLKIALHNYLENTLLINPRKEQWLLDGIQIFYIMKYVDTYYPNMKFLGSFANIWGIRSFHAADLEFNDKYTLAFMLMARTNRDQPLTMAKDSLLKFNYSISSKYKAGVGFKYLDDFITNAVVENTIQTYIKQNKLKQTSTKEFETLLKASTNKNIDWFFTDYLNTRKKIDYKIKNVKKTEDSITFTIKNREHNQMPMSLFTINNDSVVSHMWLENIIDSKTFTIARNTANKIALNYNNTIPEINTRNNWKSLKGFFFNNKPFQIRLLKDVEDPYYNQVFVMPLVEFNNIYDGLALGVITYNKTLIKKLLDYKITPKYSLNSKQITGSASMSMTHYLNDKNLYGINYGISSRYGSYAENLFVRLITPSLSFYFRENDDFRSNKRQSLIFRHLTINRDKDNTNILTSNEPNYSVFNARFIHSNDNLINYNKWYTDLQISKTFSKVAFNYEYRKLFESNRQLNLRFYMGAFIKNNNDANSNYFSFALDRPTDYLFEYPYLGRSEASGIYSQQYIEAEGGFKSKLNTPFSNQWISTINTSTTLWKYVLLYGDIGVVKNKLNSAKFVYDSGIRINLVTDYFEIYLPLYSNLGWEIGQPNYDQKLRFKFTADPQALLGLFRRRWY